MRAVPTRVRCGSHDPPTRGHGAAPIWWRKSHVWRAPLPTLQIPLIMVVTAMLMAMMIVAMSMVMPVTGAVVVVVVVVVIMMVDALVRAAAARVFAEQQRLDRDRHGE